MFKRLSAMVFGLVIAGGLGLATAPSAQATVPLRQCTGNWVNAPCPGPEAKAAPVAPRLAFRSPAPRRERHRPKPVAQRKLVHLAARTAAVCTGNWVNGACAAP